METAYSTTKNKIIHATNQLLQKTLNYWELGLRCPSCSEPVYWKSGGYSSTPHFAHFHKTYFSENCSLRVEGLSSSIGGCLSNDYLLLLKDIQIQLIRFIVDPSMFGGLLIELDEKITLNDPEERAVNLIQYPHRNIVSMYYEAYEICKRENSLENPFGLGDSYRVLDFSAKKDWCQAYLNTNKEIGREITIFLGKKSNSVILFNLARILMRKVIEDFPNQDPALKTSAYILKAIARKDWQSVLSLGGEYVDI